ncbi:HAD superfamily hydrolase (TIGR01509 family) [Allocatelliglobosispora scoriae]|uniref:HAD superfamily hydrolase (TIGR01509 family) n=1 Tax=Allocatelliglobosispora scoriae TaxID=643052 RepID=A0A841BJY6_9ACTN|nr:HAD family hydrolase [Allocatelliglobosispora scoriae]MBB5867955.1 HAD superfamily hydrolase (TIGR01509 family) [Allocatelliglobosispora scoriae]
MSGLLAVLCDMDGTLVDTEGCWAAAVEAVAAEHGILLTPRQLADRAGQAAPVTAAFLAGLGAELDGLQEQLDVAFHERVAQDGVEWRPGAQRLLDLLGAADVPLALVTASARRIADTVLATIGAERFAVTVAAEDTVRTKPHPDPYLLAMAMLGFPAEKCVAIEDTPTGVASALAAGCGVLAVPSVVAIDPAPGLVLVDSLVGVGLDLFADAVRAPSGVR